jgi:Ca2+-binding RTX toxin-like protein
MGAQIGGVSVQDDQLTVNYRTGGNFALPSGVRFNGGSAGNDKIIVVANSTEDVTYYPYSLTGRGEYSVTAGGVVLGSIYYSNIESATATDLRSLYLLTIGSQDTLTAVPTTDFAGRVATRLFGTSGTTTIVPFTFANIPNMTLDLGWADAPGSAGDRLNIRENGLRAVGLQNFTVSTGIENDLVTTQNPLLSLPVAGGEFRFNAGAGTDELAASGDTNFRLNNSRLQSDAGGRILFTELETASLTGGAGNNELTAVGFLGTVTLDGGAGNDTLRGTVNGDNLIGGLGNDQLFGQGGNDSLNGGLGSDVFNLDGTKEKDDLQLIRSTATIGRLELRAAGSPTLIEQSLFTYDNFDQVMVRALDEDDNIVVDLAFAILGTADGGGGADTCSAPTSWTKINM